MSNNRRPNKKTNRRDGVRKKHTALLPDMVDGLIPDLRPVSEIMKENIPGTTIPMSATLKPVTKRSTKTTKKTETE